MRNWLFKISARLRQGTRFFEGVYLKNPANIHLGNSAKILRGASLIATHGTIAIGDRVHINRMVSLNAEKRGSAIVLEAGVEINDGSLLLARGRITIRRDAILGPGVKLISYQHTFADPTLPIKAQPCINGDIEVGEGVWIGANAVVMAGVRIGRDAVIGAGAIVNRDVPAYAVAVGCPARVIKRRSAGEPA